MIRRTFLGVSTAAGFGALASRPSRAQTSKTRGVFFVPSDGQPRAIEHSLKKALPEWEITVFGKARDLETALKRGANVVVAPRPTLNALGLEPQLSGTLNGAATEPYSLVSVDSKVRPSDLKGESVGMLGLMGRRPMKNLSAHILGVDGVRLKTVIKYRDLLPLLQFNAARAVVLPQRFVTVLTERSELGLVVTPLPSGRVGVTAVSEQSPHAGDDLKKLPKPTLKLLGVDGWK